MINAVIADDHPLMREGIKKVLINEIDIQIIGEACDGNELLNILKDRLPDILILDLSMPGKSGFDLIKDINYRYPKLPILILSMHPTDKFAIRALKAGARGYLCKSSIADNLVCAVRKMVVTRRKYITTEIAEQLFFQLDQNNRPPHESLSDREFEILCLIAEGKSIKEIADKLSISSHTVHTYRCRIKEKMNLNSNVEMAHYAIENQLII